MPADPTLSAAKRPGSADSGTAASTRERELENALRSMRDLASVSYTGDPWYAEQEGLDAAAIFDQARRALGEDAL